MRIVLVHQSNPKDINMFSGTSHFMTNAIKEEFEEVVEYDLFEDTETYRQAHFRGVEKVLKPFGDKLNHFLRTDNIEADFILCQGGSSCIPYYQYKIPMVLWHDSSWHTFFRGYSDSVEFAMFKFSRKNLYLWDQAVLEKANMLFYSSDYVAEAAIKNYSIAADKVKVIPFGANIYQAPTDDLLEKALEERRSNRTLNLTFVGKDWKRKGLTIAFELTKALNANGVNTILNIVGSDPDISEIKTSPFVVLWGFLDKAKKKEFDKLEAIYKRTHFLIHPAAAEPFGISLCEANAYGIPVIGSAVEGLKTIVSSGKNGYLFNTACLVSEASSIIGEIVKDIGKHYPPLFRSSLNEYRTRLNWKTNVRELKRSLSDLNANRREIFLRV